MSRLFYYLSDAMRANARQKVSSTAHKIGSAWMRALSISFGLGKGIRRVRVLRTISAGNLLSQVGLARNLASRVAMLLQSDKNQAEIRPPLGRRAVHRSKWGGGGGGAGEREKKTSGTGQLSNKPNCKRVHHSAELAGAVPTFVISRDILRLPRCTRLCRYPMHAYIHAAWECKNSPDLPRCAESVLALCRPPKKEGKEIRISLTSSSARARVRQTN